MSRARVLVVRTGAMGDVLHALPAATALRRIAPETVIDWVVDPRWAPLLVDERGKGPVVSAVHLAETKKWSRHPARLSTVQSIALLRRSLQAGRYEQVIDVQGTLRSAVLGRIAGCGQRSGFADPREALAGLFYTRALPRQGVHVVEQNAALLGASLQFALEPLAPSLPVSEAAEAWADQAVGSGDRLALLVPSAGWNAKQWPARSYGALAQALGALGFRVLVNASHPHDAVAGEVVASSAGTAVLLPGDVAQLVALTRRAGVVVGGDSGPVHLAAALGRPLVALYGPTDPARNGPWGPGPMRVLRDPSSATSYKRCATVDPGLAKIPVEAVVEATQWVTSR